MSDPLFDDLFTAVAEMDEEPTGDATKDTTDEPLPSPRATPPRRPGLQSWPATAFFDIETGPIDSADLEAMFAEEWDETKVRGYELIGAEFDPESVRLGNMKDQAKIDAKIAEKRKEHERAVAEATIAVAKAREEAWLTFVERAPLSAVTGQVLAIGYGCFDGREPRIDVSAQSPPATSEAAVINEFWMEFLNCASSGVKMVGFNCFGFDLPFLIRRSWLLDVPVPVEVLHEGRYWNKTFVDLMQVWGCGQYGERIKLDRVAAFFGTARKNGDGSQFHKLFTGTDADRVAAMDYLRQDILVTAEVGRRMGIV